MDLKVKKDKGTLRSRSSVPVKGPKAEEFLDTAQTLDA